ncbi:MAG: gamma-glutamyl-gamma-aminobutyrate hydrolase family protein [Pseudomonadota bacterium]
MGSPVVLIPSDVRQVGIHPFHCVGEKYINAVVHGARAIPFVTPAWGGGEDLAPIDEVVAIDDMLDRVDGVFLTGSPSNVHPSHYGGEAREMMLDVQRDNLTLRLVTRAVARDMPILAVCRGFQEVNVALGGTLHPAVHEVDGYMDHREDTSLTRHAQYSIAHDVHVHNGGVLEQILTEQTIGVNSLHGQGVRTLAPELRVEATAPDGLVEGFSLPNGRLLGVQWHPEWRFKENPSYHALFHWFAELIRA